MLSPSERKKARGLLQNLRGEVILELYYKETEVDDFFGRLREAVYEIAKCSELIRVSGPFRSGYHLAPSVRIISSSRRNIRYAALPVGFEMFPFLRACAAPDGENSLNGATVDYLKRLSRNILIQILVAENCPSSPKMVELACRFAFCSSRVNIEVIDISRFHSIEKGIRAVPTTIIEHKQQIIGAAGEKPLLDAIKNAASEEGMIEILASLLTIGKSDRAAEIMLDRPEVR